MSISRAKELSSRIITIQVMFRKLIITEALIKLYAVFEVWERIANFARGAIAPHPKPEVLAAVK